jgi:PAS domain S-box-containing protein
MGIKVNGQVKTKEALTGELEETRKRLAGLEKIIARKKRGKQKFGILIVDDEVNPASTLRNILEATGYNTEVAHDGKTALDLCQKKMFDLALIDIKLPDISGGELIEKLVKLSPEMEYIIITGYASLDSAISAVKQKHVIAYETKPLNLDRFLSVMGQVTERKKMEDELRESEESYRALLELSAEVGEAVVILQDINHKKAVQTLVNKEWPRITGYSATELLGMSWFDLIHPEYQKTVMNRYRKRAEGKVIRGLFEVYVIRKDGTEVPIEITAGCTTLQGKQAHVIYIRDITERKRVQRGMEQAAKEWRATFDAIPDMISIHDKDFKITRVNMAFANTVKMKPQEVIGQTCYELVHGTKEPWPECPHQQVLATGKICQKEYFNPRLGIHMEVVCSPVFSEKGKVIGSVHIARDTTERKKMEEQLIATNRLASIGELAAGIAHELNNPLTSIIGFSELLLAKDVSPDVKEDLKVVNREAQRTAGVVKNLLTFARKHAPAKQLVDAHSILRAVLDLRAYEHKVSRIRVNTNLATDLPEIMADSFQLQQVFLNIIINAEYFMMEAHGRGNLTIATEQIGNAIKISFTDDGPGIPEENLGHLFDPFFTTKDVGRGTGLGLSIGHGIISEHGGSIRAESKPGAGATFIIELPVSQHEAGMNRGNE